MNYQLKRGLFVAAIALLAMGCSSARPITSGSLVPLDENGNVHRAAGPWNFDFDFAEDDTIREPLPGVKTTAQEIASYMRAHPSLTLKIDNGTEPVMGNDANTAAIQARRNLAIRKALADAGVPADKIITEGRQKAWPVRP